MHIITQSVVTDDVGIREGNNVSRSLCCLHIGSATYEGMQTQVSQNWNLNMTNVKDYQMTKDPAVEFNQCNIWKWNGKCFKKMYSLKSSLMEFIPSIKFSMSVGWLKKRLRGNKEGSCYYKKRSIAVHSVLLVCLFEPQGKSCSKSFFLNLYLFNENNGINIGGAISSKSKHQSLTPSSPSSLSPSSPGHSSFFLRYLQVIFIDVLVLINIFVCPFHLTIL